MGSLPTFEPVFTLLSTENLNFIMKKALFSLFFMLLGGMVLNAQKIETPAHPGNDAAIRKTTEALTVKYNLSADQAKQMYTIQVRKENNLAQIAGFQSSDPALYRAKAQNVQKGTLASIRRILNTKEQVEIYQKTQNETRTLRNQKQKEMTAQKASKEAIEMALLAIYAE